MAVGRRMSVDRMQAVTRRMKKCLEFIFGLWRKCEFYVSGCIDLFVYIAMYLKK